MVFKGGFFSGKMKIDDGEYTSLLKEYIDKRFSNVRIHLRGIKDGYKSNTAIDWRYLGVENKANFYLNGEKRLNFFFELEFLKDPGLRDIIRKNSRSGSEIDKSKILSRPRREYIDGDTKQLENLFADEENRKIKLESSSFREYIESLIKDGKITPDRDYYFISCRIKKIPKNPKDLFNAIWGYLIVGPLGSVTKLFR